MIPFSFIRSSGFIPPAGAVAIFNAADLTTLSRLGSQATDAGLVDAWASTEGSAIASGLARYDSKTLNGGPGVYFSGSQQLITPNQTLGIPFTTIALFRGLGTNGVVWEMSTNVVSASGHWLYTTTGATLYTNGPGGADGRDLSLSWGSQNSPLLPVHSCDGTSAGDLLSLNGVSQTLSSPQSNPGAVVFSAPISLGSRTNTTLPFTGVLGFLGEWDRELTSGEIATVVSYIRDAWDLPTAGAPQVATLLCNGDSITAGYLLSDPATQSYPARLGVTLGSSVGTPVNNGHSGFRVDEITTAWATDSATLVSGRPNIVVTMAGINDCAQSASSVTIIARLTTYAAAVNASLAGLAGGPHKNVIGTMTANAAATAPMEAVRVAVNAHLRLNYASMGFDALWDAAADEFVFNNYAALPGVYFNDLIHPNVLGAERLSAYAAQSIRLLGII